MAQGKKLKEEADAGAAEAAEAGDASAAASGAAQFESLFAAEAERSTVPRDWSKLSESKRRGLVKKEAPELQPLLEDFKAKLLALKDLLPLLKPEALARVPLSGASYLEAKASLLLSTLANLSFYLLIRAEGGAVRQHPVVSQLVWLKELHEKLAPLDERLGPRLRKARKAAAKVTAA